MTTTIPAEISAFAARVRAALSDLPADELEELTEGLEADLAEAYAEDLARELPDPVAYAAELRAAAGLPLKEDQRSGLAGGLAALRSGTRETVRDVGVAVRRHPAGRAALDLAVTLRPVWWVVRAWVATWLVMAFFGLEAGFMPRESLGWLLLLGAVLVSVQWGSGRWGAPRIRPLIAVGNVVAVVALLPVFALAEGFESRTYDQAYSGEPFVEGQDLTGLYLDGTQVTNVFAYDALGRPLRDVQLFAPDGRPLRTSVVGGSACVDESCSASGFWTPGVLADGRLAWNVFPLRLVEADGDVTGFAPGATPQQQPLPFEQAPAVDREASGRTAPLAAAFEAAGYLVPPAADPAG